ncbi:MAG: hypothetical protein WCX88_01115 [Patescibacteria group bacterium]
MSEITQKIDLLPKDIQDVLLSNIGTELEYEIFEKNKLTGNNFLIGEIVTWLYIKDLSFDDLIPKIKESFSLKDDTVAKKVALDIMGMRLLPVDEYFNGEVSKYLEKNGGLIADYSKYIQITKEAVRKELSGEVETILEENNVVVPPSLKDLGKYEYDPKEEAEDSLETFSSDLSAILADKENPYLENFNISLINLLANTPDFQGKLKKALLENKEKLTSAEFIMNDKKEIPTIENWLADFIKQKGADKFDNLVILDYISNSPNGKKLTAEESDLVGRLLKLYHNIKFFPEIFEGVSPENWEIIPTDKSEELTKIGKADEIFKKRSEVFSVPASVINAPSPSSTVDGQETTLRQAQGPKIVEVQPIKTETTLQQARVPESSQSQGPVSEQAQGPIKAIGKIQSPEIQNNLILINSKIGGNQIQLVDKTVEPSLKNWLVSYQNFIGMPSGTLPARMSYLNNSVDAKNLNMLDKERLSLVLKSYDEGIDLEFNLSVDGSLDVSLPKRETKVDDLSIADSYMLTSASLPVQTEKPEAKIETKPAEVKKDFEKQIDFSKDNQEISLLGNKIAEKDNSIDAEIKTKVDQIVLLTGKKFENQTLTDRFRNIILTRVKDIRNKLQTQEYFIKAIEVGGLGMRQDSAEYITDKIENFLTGEIKKQPKKKQIDSLKTARIDLTPTELPKVEPVQPSSNIKSEIEKIEDLIKDLPAEREAPAIIKDIKPKESFNQTTQINNFMDLAVPAPVTNLSRSDKSDKITDVILKAKPVGPIEELRALDLENFKRFEGSAMDKVTKISKRIAVLEGESLIKKAEGIKAWKQSEVYRLYQEMGQESLMSGSKITEIIVKRQQAKKPYLSQEEFDAIGNLNKSLRF